MCVTLHWTNICLKRVFPPLCALLHRCAERKHEKENLPHLVFQSSSDLDLFLRAALCFSSSLFLSSLAKSEDMRQKVKGQT